MERFKGTLYDFQTEAVKYILERCYCILAYDAGVGKTPITIATSLNVTGTTLVVVPAFLKVNWLSEYNKFTPTLDVIIVNKVSDIRKCDVMVVSYSMIKKLLHDLIKIAFNFIALDEVHYIKNLSSLRTKAIHNLISSTQPEYCVGLSATPIKNRVSEFYSLFKICSYVKFPTNGLSVMSKFRTLFSFATYFSNPIEMNIGGRKITKFEGHRNVGELKELMANKYKRKKISECVTLPKLSYKEVLVKDTSAEKSLAQAWEDYGAESTVFPVAKAVNALSKAKYTSEYVLELLESVDSVVVFSDHVKAVEEITNLLTAKRVKVVGITGQTVVNKRAEYVKQFQEKKIQVLVATIGALKEGVTLTATNHLIFNDISWVPADNFQAERRIYRISQTLPCLVHFILSGKIDKHIVKTLQKKQATIEEVL